MHLGPGTRVPNPLSLQGHLWRQASVHPAGDNRSGTGARQLSGHGIAGLSGTSEVGQTLTASTSGISDADGLDNVSFSYQWIANDGTADTDIQGATASTYTLSDADVGKTVKVRVSFTDDAGNRESLTSNAYLTAPPVQDPSSASDEPPANSPATGSPTITGTARVGRTLTADASDIGDPGGMDDAGTPWS